MRKKAIQWLHWFLYGEWAIEVCAKRKYREYESADRDVVATPFISARFLQKMRDNLEAER